MSLAVDADIRLHDKHPTDHLSHQSAQQQPDQGEFQPSVLASSVRLPPHTSCKPSPFVHDEITKVFAIV